jgi:nicotinate phosphoribosyltransferase
MHEILTTDLYELAMMQAYLEAGNTKTAVLEFFVRKLPVGRNFLMAAGLAQALDYLENLSAPPEPLDWLRRSGRFGADFIDHLATLRFAGDVHAMPEGTVFFPEEPILRVTAPPPEAQFIETRLTNLLHLETVIASKAARMVLAAERRQLVDFGLRRAHGSEAGLLAARASYIAGFSGSATVLAGQRFGLQFPGLTTNRPARPANWQAEALSSLHFVIPCTRGV